MNLLGRFYRVLSREGRRVSQAQRRLVASRLESVRADDAFAHSRETQFRQVAVVLAQFVGIAPSVVESYLRSC
jgi:hypothetical protein